MDFVELSKTTTYKDYKFFMSEYSICLILGWGYSLTSVLSIYFSGSINPSNPIGLSLVITFASSFKNSNPVMFFIINFYQQ